MRIDKTQATNKETCHLYKKNTTTTTKVFIFFFIRTVEFFSTDQFDHFNSIDAMKLFNLLYNIQ